MTTVQESTNGHLPQKGYPPAAKVYQQDELSSLNEGALFAGNKVSPPPFSIENPGEPKPADLPTDKANNNQFANDDQVVGRQKGVSSRESHGDQELSRVKKSTPLLAHEKVTEAFPANAYHVPPKRFTPRAYPYRRDDMLNLPPETEPLPQRCQFMFSDGRQCTMARSDIHPSLCPYHSEREEQLFGTPGSGRGAVVGGSFDLAELYSACADLTTAAGVNRALGLVFRLLAQRRISRQEAATFGHLAQLLLRSISLMRSESIAPENEQPMIPVGGRQKGLAITPLLPHEKDVRSSDPHPHTTPTPKPGPSLDPPSAVSQASSDPNTAKNSSGINTSADSIRNSLEINTYENAGLETLQNEHLRKSGTSQPQTTLQTTPPTTLISSQHPSRLCLDAGDARPKMGR